MDTKDLLKEKEILEQNIKAIMLNLMDEFYEKTSIPIKDIELEFVQHTTIETIKPQYILYAAHVNLNI